MDTVVSVRFVSPTVNLSKALFLVLCPNTFYAIHLHDVLMYRAGKLCLIPGYSYFCGEDLFQCDLRSWWNIQPQLVHEHIVGCLDDRVGSPEKP